MKRILFAIVALVIIFVVLISIFLPSLVRVGIKEVNSNTSVSITEDDVTSSFPLGVKMQNVKIATDLQPLLTANLNLIEIKPCLFSLFKLNAGGKIYGKMYEGEFTLLPFKNLLKDEFNVGVDIKNLNFSKYQLLSLFPISGGYITTNANANLSETKVTVKNGNFSFKDFDINEEFYLKKELTSLPLDLKLPKLHIKNTSFLYDLNKNILEIKEFNLASSILNLNGNCNLNIQTQKLKNCDIEFDFTDEGWQEYSSWIALLTSNKVKENRKFTVSLKGNISYPKYEIK